MKHLAAYMLLVMGGNKSPTRQDVTEALAKVGVEVDEDRLDQLLGALEGVDHEDLNKLLEAGKERLAQFGPNGSDNKRSPNKDVVPTGDNRDENTKDDGDDSVVSLIDGPSSGLLIFDEGEDGDY